MGRLPLPQARPFQNAAVGSGLPFHPPPPLALSDSQISERTPFASPACGRGRARAARPGEGGTAATPGSAFQDRADHALARGKAALSARPRSPHPDILRMSDLSRKRERQSVRTPAAGVADRCVNAVAPCERGRVESMDRLRRSNLKGSRKRERQSDGAGRGASLARWTGRIVEDRRQVPSSRGQGPKHSISISVSTRILRVGCWPGGRTTKIPASGSG